MKVQINKVKNSIKAVKDLNIVNKQKDQHNQNSINLYLQLLIN